MNLKRLACAMAAASALLLVSAPSATSILTYEDGSGIQVTGTAVVRHFPSDTFAWNCETQGNKLCGKAAS